MLEGVRWLHQAPPAFVRDLAPLLKPFACASRGEVVCRDDDLGLGLFLLHTGHLDRFLLVAHSGDGGDLVRCQLTAGRRPGFTLCAYGDPGNGVGAVVDRVTPGSSADLAGDSLSAPSRVRPPTAVTFITDSVAYNRSEPVP